MSRELSLAEIFQLGYYWETKILLTAVRLDVFSALDGKRKTLHDVAGRLGVHGQTLGLLLNALVAMRLLEKDGDSYGNSTAAATHLVRNSAQYIGHLLLLHDAEWDNWGKLEQTIRTGQRSVDRHVFETDPDLGSNVLAVLHRIGQQSGPDFAKRLQLSGPVRFLDLGGGAGTNAIAFCQAYPELTATVFDLPATLRLTERTVKEVGLESRIALLPGDFNKDGLGGPYDVALMSDILHYQDFSTNAALVKRVWAHLAPGGRLVIKDRFLNEAGTGPAWTTAFAVHILGEHGTRRLLQDGRCDPVDEGSRFSSRDRVGTVSGRAGYEVWSGLRGGRARRSIMLEWLKQPGFFGTHATVGADMSQLMATVFTGLFVIGWIQARRRRADAHHWMMLSGMIAMLAFFISYYLFRQLGVLAFEGKGGSVDLKHSTDNVFIPLLIIHIILVVIGLVMAVYMIVLGFRAQLIEQGRRILSDRVLQTTWGKIGMIFGAPLRAGGGVLAVSGDGRSFSDGTAHCVGLDFSPLSRLCSPWR